jgi:hypothetical protein
MEGLEKFDGKVFLIFSEILCVEEWVRVSLGDERIIIDKNSK